MTDQQIDRQTPGTITGYRKHSQDQIDQVNRNKDFENKLGDLIQEIRGQDFDVDMRWMAVARTHFQEGFMALNRAVFQPESRL